MNNNSNEKGSSLLFGVILLFILVLVFALMLPPILNFVVNVQDSTSAEFTVDFNITYTDNNNVIITHNNGPDVNAEKVIVNIDDVQSPVQFEDTIKQGDSIYITEKEDGSEFVGNERIDIVIVTDDSSYIIKTKRLNSPF